MLKSAPLSIDSVVNLRTLLDLRDSSDSRCHGNTKKGPRCKNPVRSANAVVVDALLAKAATAISYGEKCQILRKIASLTICKIHYEKQRSAIVSVWEKLIKDTEVAVKLELEQESDISEDDSDTSEDDSDTSEDDSDTSEDDSDTSEDDSDTSEDEDEDPATIVQEQDKAETKAAPLSKKPTKSHPVIKVEPLPARQSTISVKPKVDLFSIRAFKPYSAHRGTFALNSFIKSILLKPLTLTSLPSKEKPGYVYVYTFAPSPGKPLRYLKIGYASDVAARLKAWSRQCGTPTTLLCRFETDLYMRVEQIVHAHLANERLLEHEGCSACGVRHKEWFNVKLRVAAKVLGLWTSWSWQTPYNEDGLLKTKWKKKLDKVDLSSQDCWEEFVS